MGVCAQIVTLSFTVISPCMCFGCYHHQSSLVNNPANVIYITPLLPNNYVHIYINTSAVTVSKALKHHIPSH